MKKTAYVLALMALTFFSACNRGEVELVFDKPADGRIADTLSYLKNSLVGAEHGWVAHTTTDLTGGYGFYFDFRANDRVKMVADITGGTASAVKESSYRVRQIMSATLSFDTYNYITMLQDPTPGTLGGDAGKGFGSDVEYEYIKTAGDTLFLRGRKFKKDLVLIKATNVQKQQYIDGEYATAIDKITDFFVQNANPYIEIGNIKYQVSINEARKNTDAIGVLPGNAIVTTADKFYFTLDGIKIVGGMAVGGEVFVAYQWIEGRLYAISRQGTPYEIKNSTAPILPLHLLMGTKYSGLRSSHAVEFPGSSVDGLTILRRYYQGLGNGAAGYFFNCGTLVLEWTTVNKRIRVRGFASQNGCASGWYTDTTFDYVLDGATGAFSLTKRSGPIGGYTTVILDQLLDFLENSSFTLEYVVDGSDVYGKMVGVERPGVEISFSLY